MIHLTTTATDFVRNKKKDWKRKGGKGWPEQPDFGEYFHSLIASETGQA